MPDCKRVPRCVYIDLEPSVIDQIRSGPFQTLFNEDSFVSGKEDSGNVHTRGAYTLGKEISENHLDKIRK